MYFLITSSRLRMKNACNSIESSNTCESVRDKRRALSKHANTSSWNISKRLYSPLSKRRFIKSNDIPRTLNLTRKKTQNYFRVFGNIFWHYVSV